MAIDVKITGGEGEFIRRLAIKPHGDALVVDAAHPPYGGTTTMLVFRQFFTDDGLSTGSSDMRVDGSSTNVDFWIPAHSERDRYITKINFTISDSAATLNNFGTLSALTNGCKFFYQDFRGDIIIHEALKSNYNFIQLCSGQPAFAGSGATNSSFRAQNVSGTSEGYLPSLDMKSTFGFQWGLRLAAGTDQRLIMTVRDDATGVDAFNMIAYGFERLPDD